MWKTAVKVKRQWILYVKLYWEVKILQKWVLFTPRNQQSIHKQEKGTNYSPCCPALTAHDLLSRYITVQMNSQRRQNRFRDWETDKEGLRHWKTAIERLKIIQELYVSCFLSSLDVFIKAESHKVWPSHSVGLTLFRAEWVKRLSQGYTMPSDTDIQLLSCMPQAHWFALGPTPCVSFRVCSCVRQPWTLILKPPTKHRFISVEPRRAILYITWLATNTQKIPVLLVVDGEVQKVENATPGWPPTGLFHSRTFWHVRKAHDG